MRATAALAAVSAALLVVTGATASTRAVGGTGTMFTVAFDSGTLPANVDKLVADAGGTIVVRIPELGGLGVSSSSPSFASKISLVASVGSAEPSTKTSLPGDRDKTGDHAVSGFWKRWIRATGQRRHNRTPGIGDDPQPEPDNLGAQQWDKMRMNVSSTGSYRLDRGRSDVTVAFTDTGVDQTHPDIAPNLDVADSKSFFPGDDSIQDFNGHGTWVASAVGAPINKIGISGVAPKVSIVALKTQDPNGDGLQLYIDQALVYAAQKGFDIVSSSIIGYGETCQGPLPPDYECDNADYLLAQRAVNYARARGVTIIAALGNDNRDVADRAGLAEVFGVPDPVAEVLGSLDGVIGVTATGYTNDKAYYSNYGLGAADVTAPGGDPVFQLPPTPPYLGEGRVLGAWSSTATEVPTFTTTDCVGTSCGLYAWIAGTSMATPNAAGVAALIVSHYGDFGRHNRGSHMSPNELTLRLTGTATAIPCPNPRTVQYGGQFPYDEATCEGPTRYNGFYGAGMVNAVAALTRGGF